VEGIWSIVGLSVGSLLFSIRACLYCITYSRTPRLGTRISSGRSVNDFSLGWRRVAPCVLAVVCFMIKISALSLDRWDQLVYDGPLVGKGRIWFGLFQMRHEADGRPTTTTTYASRCRQPAMETEPHALSVCRSLRAAGVMTFLTVLFSLVASMLLIVLALRSCGNAGLQTQGVRLWRWSGLAQTGSFFACLFWLVSAHTILHWQDGAGISQSWVLVLVSWLFELVLLIFMRRLVASVPEVPGARAQYDEDRSGDLVPSAHPDGSSSGGGAGPYGQLPHGTGDAHYVVGASDTAPQQQQQQPPQQGFYPQLDLANALGGGYRQQQ
jgi:hypothetical protein